MKNKGIGCDIVKIERFKNFIEDKFKLERFFTLKEIKFFERKNEKAISSIAANFAGKEAFIKAFSQLVGKKVKYSLKDIEVLRDKLNVPYIKLENELKEALREYKINLSLSHERDYALAFVIIG